MQRLLRLDSWPGGGLNSGAHPKANHPARNATAGPRQRVIRWPLMSVLFERTWLA